MKNLHEKLEFWFLPEKCHICLEEVFRLMLFSKAFFFLLLADTTANSGPLRFIQL